MKRKSVIQATSLDQFLEKQRIYVGGESQHDIHTTDDLPPSFVDEHNRGLDDLAEHEEIGADGCAGYEDMTIDCSTNGMY